jgi:hypothetical protein
MFTTNNVFFNVVNKSSLIGKNPRKWWERHDVINLNLMLMQPTTEERDKWYIFLKVFDRIFQLKIFCFVHF